MRKHHIYTLLLLALALTASGVSAIAQGTNQSLRASTETPANARIGVEVTDFTLPDVDGKEHSLRSLKGKQGTAVIFVSTQCPVSNGYHQRMLKLAADYAARGVNVIGINANSTEAADVVKRHASENNLSFPILKDAGNKIADRLGARVTPEVFLLDANNRLVYHGRIDNSQKGEAVSSNDLRDAIDTMLQGKAVTKTEAPAFGCSIKRVS